MFGWCRLVSEPPITQRAAVDLLGAHQALSEAVPAHAIRHVIVLKAVFEAARLPEGHPSAADFLQKSGKTAVKQRYIGVKLALNWRQSLQISSSFLKVALQWR